MPIKEVKTITIVKKSWGYQLGVLGMIAGVSDGAEKVKTNLAEPLA